jgi:hypothetical protein
MRFFILMLVLAVPALALAKPARPKNTPKPAGILVLDNCDDQYEGKDEYQDNLTLVDPERFSSEGKSQAEHPVAALALQVDAAGSDVWVVTPTEVQRMTFKGGVTARINHAGITSQAWIASLD